MPKRRLLEVGLLCAALLLLTACGSDSKEYPEPLCKVGEAGCACDVNGNCLSGNTCVNGLCVAAEDGDPDLDTAERAEDGDSEAALDGDESPAEQEADGETAQENDRPDAESEAQEGEEQTAEQEQTEESEAEGADSETDSEPDSDTEEAVELCPCSDNAATYCLDPTLAKPQTLVPERIVVTVKDNATCKFGVAFYEGQDTIGGYEATGCSALFPNQVLSGYCTLSAVNVGELLSLSCGESNPILLAYSQAACPAVHCRDLDTDFDESDLNCGGSCPPCQDTQACRQNGDCKSKHCVEKACAAPVCPDGIVNGSEQCDDGNTEGADGCTANCMTEPGWLCTGSPSVCAPPCETKNDCQAPLIPKGPCYAMACVNKNCAEAPLSYGTMAPEQIPGDCKHLICDGAGQQIEETDDADAPSGGSCLYYVCQEGAPITKYVESKTACAADRVCDGLGNCVECLADSDCGTSTACVTYSCHAGVCSTNTVALGTVVADPAPGDCHSDRCDGAGHIESNAIDDNDLPVDGNDCTQDLCTNGVPTNQPTASGSYCAQNGGSYCDGAGTCVECRGANDCGASTACATFVCTAGSCRTNATASGTVVANPTSGDCRSDQCDGAGHITQDAADDTDKPVDNKECTLDICAGGAPGNPPVPPGMACSQNGGSKCDGNGNCVQCTMGSDCGVSTACMSYSCNAGTCAMNNTPAGVVVENPLLGDCRSWQCNGYGSISIDAIDNNDTPADDGNQCTSDTCNAGSPVHPPKPSGAPCNQNGGSICDGVGNCIP